MKKKKGDGRPKMTRLYLVRHGKAAAAWDADYDPGLDDIGRAEAEKTARALASLGPMEIISSPLARARQTAMPLAERWGALVRIEERVGEIPSPVKGLKERGEWFGDLIGKNWSALPRNLHVWRKGVIDALVSLDRDTVVFSHFIAISAAVGVATEDDRVVNFWPGNGSVTEMKTDNGALVLIQLGSEGETQLL